MSIEHIPFRPHRGIFGPAWRQQLAPTLPLKLLAMADRYLRDYRGYHLMRQATDDEVAADAAEQYPIIAAAEALQKSSKDRRKLELLLAADISPEEIAERLQIPAEHLAAWEAIYFDVRDSEGATTWFAHKVIGRSLKNGDAIHAAELRMARTAGPVGVRLILDDEDGSLLDVAEQVALKLVRLETKLDVALAMPCASEHERIALLQITTDMQIARNRVELEREQLVESCRLARERHELARAQVQSAAAAKQGEASSGGGPLAPERTALTPAPGGARQPPPAPSALSQLGWTEGPPPLAIFLGPRQQPGNDASPSDSRRHSESVVGSAEADLTVDSPQCAQSA